MPVIKLRVEISKDEEIRYISHLDYAGAIEKALKACRNTSGIF